MHAKHAVLRIPRATRSSTLYRLAVDDLNREIKPVKCATTAQSQPGWKPLRGTQYCESRSDSNTTMLHIRHMSWHHREGVALNFFRILCFFLRSFASVVDATRDPAV